MRKVTLPYRFQHRQHLLHVGAALALRDAGRHDVELALIGAAADAEAYSSANSTRGFLDERADPDLFSGGQFITHQSAS